MTSLLKSGMKPNIGLSKNMKIKKGDICSFRTYVKVESVNSDEITVEDVNSGVQFKIQGQELLDSLDSSVEYVKEEKLAKTALAEKFVEIDEKPFTVCFEKKDKSLRELSGKKSGSRRSAVLGYSSVFDLNLKAGDNRERQVNHNQIKWFVCDGVKYSLK